MSPPLKEVDYDNMMYNSVYGKGPQDVREPLYHSEPFWIEANGSIGYQSKVGTFVANYSQICVDLGAIDDSQIRIATRFDNADHYIIAEKDVSQVLRQYTAIVGRPWLKPRYALGYGQACYGYDTRKKVEDIVQGYRDHDFPLDTVHIDVDMQDNYRTFTVDQSPHKFPNPSEMFSKLRKLGVKCSTNITPFINCEDCLTYETLNQLLQKEYFVPDERYSKGGVAGFEDQRYVCYEGGELQILDPNVDRSRLEDGYVFENSFDGGGFKKNIPYRGGVYYGKNLGKPGYYPDLNRPEVRNWWGDQYKDLIAHGLEFVWQDMTSPAISKEYGDMKSYVSSRRAVGIFADLSKISLSPPSDFS